MQIPESYNTIFMQLWHERKRGIFNDFQDFLEKRVQLWAVLPCIFPATRPLIFRRTNTSVPSAVK